jgi:hypothetical protein
MNVLKPEYLVDTKGNKTKVLLSYDSYLELLMLIEDLEDLKLIDQVRNEPETKLSDYKRKRNIVSNHS